MVTGRVPYEAPAPTEVMKKHLKEALTPPDHINTALTAGISEVIEVMMAKDRDNRYKNMEELMTDLKAVQQGGPPLLARQKFNVEALEQLEEGMAIETPAGHDAMVSDEILDKYRMGLIALGIFSLLLILTIVLMAIYK
jgi:serine/threonine protein kinase